MPNGELIDPATNKLNAKAIEVISEWYDKYSDNTGVMTPASATRFILGATNELIRPDDNRIVSLFSGYDGDKDGFMQREEFIKFYEDASLGKAERVFDNIKNHFIRGDLTKFSDLY
jgi:hypothetical protein